MGRASTVTDGQKSAATQLNDIIADYLSQTDTTLQDIASNVDFAAAKRPKFDFTLLNPASVPANVEGHFYFDSATHRPKFYDGTVWLFIPGVSALGGTSFEGTGTGTSPITIAHGLGGSPSIVLVSVNAAQPYAVAYDKDATNVYVYHNALGALTVSIRAVL